MEVIDLRILQLLPLRNVIVAQVYIPLTRCIYRCRACCTAVAHGTRMRVRHQVSFDGICVIKSNLHALRLQLKGCERKAPHANATPKDFIRETGGLS
jgi:hypothetical protein